MQKSGGLSPNDAMVRTWRPGSWWGPGIVREIDCGREATGNQKNQHAPSMTAMPEQRLSRSDGEMNGRGALMARRPERLPAAGRRLVRGPWARSRRGAGRLRRSVAGGGRPHRVRWRPCWRWALAVPVTLPLGEAASTVHGARARCADGSAEPGRRSSALGHLDPGAGREPPNPVVTDALPAHGRRSRDQGLEIVL